MKKEQHHGTCPICQGTLRMQCPDNLRIYGQKYGWYGYQVDDDKVTCNNCGGQYQMGCPTGKVRLRPDMFPCIHEYTEKNIGRCLHQHTCTHCGDVYDIDSSD